MENLILFLKNLLVVLIYDQVRSKLMNVFCYVLWTSNDTKMIIFKQVVKNVFIGFVCLLILSFLQNYLFLGTVHIYSISRSLMSLGHSAKVLEYLLWACMCMETSVPLLTVKYLSWRSTLYTAVCQCYFDCKATEQAEV